MDDRWHIFATPGHSPDHVSLFDGEVLIAGDAASLEGAIAPRRGGDGGALRASLETLKNLKPEWVLSGHGPPFEGSRLSEVALHVEPKDVIVSMRINHGYTVRSTSQRLT